MTEQNLEDLIECATCGLNGRPPTGCPKCGGNAPVQSRQYTLSEIRSGRAPKDDREPTEALGPKIIKLPGSGGQGV